MPDQTTTVILQGLKRLELKNITEVYPYLKGQVEIKDEEIPDKTKLIIAQRISSVQDADRIIVMENGKVNGFGSHEELLKTNEIYCEVYESQTGGGGDFDEKRGE